MKPLFAVLLLLAGCAARAESPLPPAQEAPPSAPATYRVESVIRPEQGFHGSMGAEVRCRAGDVLAMGGCAVSPGNALRMSMPTPRGDGWDCTGEDLLGDGASTIAAVAECAPSR